MHFASSGDRLPRATRWGSTRLWDEAIRGVPDLEELRLEVMDSIDES